MSERRDTLDTAERNTATESTCIWKLVVNASLSGTGTSYAASNLSATQKECRDCPGDNSACWIYLPEH